MDHPVAFYRRMLRVYPAKFRQAYGEAMTQLFADLLADERRSGQPLGIFRLWVRTVVGTLSSASKERKEQAMNNNAALTRGLLVAVFIAVWAGFAFGGGASWRSRPSSSVARCSPLAGGRCTALCSNLGAVAGGCGP